MIVSPPIDGELVSGDLQTRRARCRSKWRRSARPCRCLARSGTRGGRPAPRRHPRWLASSRRGPGSPGIRTVEGICPGDRCRWYCAPASLVGASARRSFVDIGARTSQRGLATETLSRAEVPVERSRNREDRSRGGGRPAARVRLAPGDGGAGGVAGLCSVLRLPRRGGRAGGKRAIVSRRQRRGGLLRRHDLRRAERDRRGRGCGRDRHSGLRRSHSHTRAVESVRHLPPAAGGVRAGHDGVRGLPGRCRDGGSIWAICCRRASALRTCGHPERAAGQGRPADERGLSPRDRAGRPARAAGRARTDGPSPDASAPGRGPGAGLGAGRPGRRHGSGGRDPVRGFAGLAGGHRAGARGTAAPGAPGGRAGRCPAGPAPPLRGPLRRPGGAARSPDGTAGGERAGSDECGRRRQQGLRRGHADGHRRSPEPDRTPPAHGAERPGDGAAVPGHDRRVGRRAASPPARRRPSRRGRSGRGRLRVPDRPLLRDPGRSADAARAGGGRGWDVHGPGGGRGPLGRPARVRGVARHEPGRRRRPASR